MTESKPAYLIEYEERSMNIEKRLENLLERLEADRKDRERIDEEVYQVHAQITKISEQLELLDNCLPTGIKRKQPTTEMYRLPHGIHHHHDDDDVVFVSSNPPPLKRSK